MKIPKTASIPERRRRTQREYIRNEILDAARKLVEQDGATALTMRAVATAVGYSPGALYEYFGSKSEILEAMYFQGTQGLEGRTRQVIEVAGPNVSILDQVAMAGRAYRSYALDHPDLYQLIFTISQSSDGIPPHEPEQRDSTFGSLLDMLRTAIDRGEVVDGDPERMAASLWAFVHGFVMLEITGRLPDDPPGATDALFETGLSLLSHGLRPRDGEDEPEARTAS